MSSTLASRGNPVYALTGVDFSAALGKLVTFTGGIPAVNASATVPASGIVLDGNTASLNSSIGFLGANLPPVRAQISSSSAVMYQGDGLMQAADGTLTKDVGTGTPRVVVGCLSDPNGAQPGDIAEVTLFAGQIRS